MRSDATALVAVVWLLTMGAIGLALVFAITSASQRDAELVLLSEQLSVLEAKAAQIERDRQLGCKAVP